MKLGFSRSLLNIQGGTVKAWLHSHPGHQNQYCAPPSNLCSFTFAIRYFWAHRLMVNHLPFKQEESGFDSQCAHQSCPGSPIGSGFGLKNQKLWVRIPPRVPVLPHRSVVGRLTLDQETLVQIQLGQPIMWTRSPIGSGNRLRVCPVWVRLPPRSPRSRSSSEECQIVDLERWVQLPSGPPFGA